jgi:type VI secretion system secreted protein VgrG
MPEHREITAKTALGDVLKFAAMEGEEEIGRCFRYQLDLVSEDITLAAKDLLGKPAVVAVGPNAPRHFHGIVTAFGLTGMRDGYAQFRAILRPTLWFLSNTTDNRIFQNMSVVEIVKDVLGAVPADWRLRGSYPPRDYCVQYGESDLAFVQRLLEHEGIFYFFEHSEAGHVLVLSDDSASLPPVPGFETVSWQSDSLVTFIDGDFVTRWAPVTSVRSGAYTHTAYDFEKPSADLMAKAENALGHDEDAAEVYHYPGNHIDLGRGDALARIRLQELQAPHRRVEAEGTARGLWPGASFTLKRFPSEAEDGAYIVLRAAYRMWDDRYRAGMERTDQGFEIAMTVAPKDLPFRPERRTPKPRMAGPQTAVVVGPAGSEIYTDEYSRVKVQFFWDREGRHDESTTCFIRVSATWAGAGWGFIQIPRIGQEVIVDFLEGDPDQPVITGRLYNAEQMPPYGLPGNATQSGWKSNSSPGGGGWNELRFEDKAGSEEVYFQAQKDHNELVKNDESRIIGHDFSEDVGNDAQQSVGHNRTESVGNDKSTSVGNNRSVSIGVNDDETVGSNRSLTVGANETIGIGANSTETIGLNHSQSVGVNQSVTVGAARVDTVGAAETRTVGAAQVQTVGATRTVTVGAAQSHAIGAGDSWTIAADQSVSVGASQSTDVGSDRSVSVGASQTVSVGSDQTVTISGNDTLTVGGNGSDSIGKKYRLTVADEIAIVCGSAQIVMKKNGDITIKGKDIQIEGSGKINVKASSDMTLKASKINAN